MAIKFGSAGLGGRAEAISNLQRYKKAGLEACEVAFTYGVYLREEDARKIGKEAKKLGIKLSIHAPYWINLNSKEKKKIEDSKKRILDCCRIGHLLGAYLVVFHPGYYGNMDKDETFENIAKAIKEIRRQIKRNHWRVNIAAETTGKVNVFGSVDEILKLMNKTSCYFCIDFAHILAREKKADYAAILKKFNKFKNLHIHFSGIVYGEKGERRHILTKKKELKKLLEVLKKLKGKNIVVINESPDPVEDSIKSFRLYNNLN